MKLIVDEMLTSCYECIFCNTEDGYDTCRISEDICSSPKNCTFLEVHDKGDI